MNGLYYYYLFNFTQEYECDIGNKLYLYENLEDFFESCSKCPNDFIIARPEYDYYDVIYYKNKTIMDIIKLIDYLKEELFSKDSETVIKIINESIFVLEIEYMKKQFNKNIIIKLKEFKKYIIKNIEKIKYNSLFDEKKKVLDKLIL